MDIRNEQFLTLLRAALLDASPEPAEDLTREDLQELFSLAEIHQVLPLIYEAVCRIPGVKNSRTPELMTAKQQVFQQVMLQTMKTAEFLMLNRHLQSSGLRPLTVKGIVCRSLYPKPDLRPSGDEDVLIPPEHYPRCHEAMKAFGMETAEPDEKTDTSYEVPYGKPGSPLYIELHKYLFPPESKAYGHWNRFFEEVHSRAVQEIFDGTPVYTMEYSDHFFYLICHSFKHFLHSGFGIRQVCDIVLYANKYGHQIRWESVLERCREIRAEKFTAALLRIGEKYLVFDPELACYPACWQEIAVDEAAMLEDLLSSGIYGASTMSRKHSSTMTLDAMAASNKGKKARSSVMGSLFPPLQLMSVRYPYLQEKPWLLPVAWCQRIAKYGRETRGAADNNAAETLKIGKERIALMRQYGIIE